MRISPINNQTYTFKGRNSSHNNEPKSESWSNYRKEKFTKNVIQYTTSIAAGIVISGMILSNKQLQSALHDYKNSIRQQELTQWIEANEDAMQMFQEDSDSFVKQVEKALFNEPIKKSETIGSVSYLESANPDNNSKHYDSVTHCVPFKGGYEVVFNCSDMSRRELDNFSVQNLLKKGKIDSVYVDVNQDGIADLTYEFDGNGKVIHSNVDTDFDGYSDICSNGEEEQMPDAKFSMIKE